MLKIFKGKNLNLYMSQCIYGVAMASKFPIKSLGNNNSIFKYGLVDLGNKKGGMDVIMSANTYVHIPSKNIYKYRTIIPVHENESINVDIPTNTPTENISVRDTDRDYSDDITVDISSTEVSVSHKKSVLVLNYDSLYGDYTAKQTEEMVHFFNKNFKHSASSTNVVLIVKDGACIFKN